MSLRQIEPIKFIYFDVGGVAILDFSKTNKWQEMMADLGIKDQLRESFSNLFEQHTPDICIGQDTKVFVEDARQNLGISFPVDYDMTRDFVRRFEPNPYLADLITRLKSDYPIGLLTDQYPRMLSMIFARGLLKKSDWPVIIDSSVVKLSKHNSEMFSLAEQTARVNPKNILFVENSPQHLATAQQQGWQTFEYDPADPQSSTAALQKLIYPTDK